jgi:hypothetical protein
MRAQSTQMFSHKLYEETMRAHRFGRKLKLPATTAIKHQIRILMLEDLLKEAAVAATAEEILWQQREVGDPSILHQVDVMVA